MTVPADGNSLVSIVIPVYNEVASLRPLYEEIVAAESTFGRSWEIVFVDDGSRDGSWLVIDQLATQDHRVRGIRFRRNFGKAAALLAGFRIVRGSVTMTLDADLQDDPKEIPRFLALLEEGYDVISGWKKIRHDPWHKVFPSRVFNGMVSRLTGVYLHDHNCGMKCYRTAVLREVRLYGELHRFIPVLAEARGFRIGELVIEHRARQFGYSKYGVRRFLKGFLDLLTVKFITSFSRRPQHIMGGLGLFAFFLGSSGLIWLALTWLIRYFDPASIHEPLHNRPLMIYSLGALLLGAQLMAIGFLAELLIVYQSRDEDAFSIADTTSSPSRHDPA